MSIKPSKCVECGSNALTEFEYTMEHQENNKTLPAIKCNNCGEIYITPEASKMLDN